MSDMLFPAANPQASSRAGESVSFSGIARLLLAPLSLSAAWYRRARLRAELATDLRERPDYLRDIGICEHAARREAVRFFWEPVLLKHRRFEMADTPMR
jgi:uncharacterized protein YjiS (DUF1127 family)